MKALIKKDTVKELLQNFKMNVIEKSHKYIRRWFSGGEWHYKYPQKYQPECNRTKTKIDISKKTPLITGIKPLSNATEKQIDEALVKLSLYAMDGNLKCPALGNHSIYISRRTQEHVKETKGIFRSEKEMQHKAKYIPFIPEILKNGRICEKSSSMEGVIYGIIGQVEYFDETKQKTVKESVELAINFDNDSRKFVFSFGNFAIKKSLLDSRDLLTTFLACPVGACNAEALSTTNINVYPNIDYVNKIKKKGSSYTGEPLMVNEKTTERSKFRIKNDSRSDNGAITPTTNISQINKMSKLKLDYDGKNMLHKSFDIKISDITESNREKKIEQTEKALNAIYNNQPFVIRHIKAEKGEGVLKNLVLRISDFDKNKIEKAVHSMQFTLDTKIKAGSGEAFLYKSQEELTDLFVEELTEKTKAIYSFVIAYFGLPEIRVLSKSDLKYKGKVVYDPETGKPISKAEWNKFVKTLEDFLNRNYKGIGKRIVLSAETLGRMLERLSKSKSLSELKIYIFYVHEVFTEDDLKKRDYHAHIESKFAATYRKASA